MPKLTISTTFDVPDNGRAQANIMAGLHGVAEQFEAEIKTVAGVEATFDMRVVRQKVSRPTSSELQHG